MWLFPCSTPILVLVFWLWGAILLPRSWRIYKLTATLHHPSLSTFWIPSLPLSHSHTSTSRSPSCTSDATPMSKHVTIMTRDLHRLTQYSSSSVTCSRASRYSCDSLSKSWSTSTVRKEREREREDLSKQVSGLHDITHCFSTPVAKLNSEKVKCTTVFFKIEDHWGLTRNECQHEGNKRNASLLLIVLSFF